MPKSPPKGMPRLTPYVYYKDVKEAIHWLEDVFGFTSRFEPVETNHVLHGEMAYKDAVFMLGTANGDHGSHSPQDHGAVNQSIYLYVDDVKAHYEKAVEGGADILMPPIDMAWGDRIYSVHDLEGHHWTFAEHLRDVKMA